MDNKYVNITGMYVCDFVRPDVIFCNIDIVGDLCLMCCILNQLNYHWLRLNQDLQIIFT